MQSLPQGQSLRIHPAGWPFIGIAAAATVLLFAAGWLPGVLGVIATAWVVYFFRDPDRATPVRPGLIVAPADGRVVAITDAAPPAELESGTLPLTRVSIFLDIFDVHVNRVPVDGTVARLRYTPGRFFNASLDKASAFNERTALRIVTDDGLSVIVVQIAGLIARRIKTWVAEGSAVRAGERFGLIRFGSRVDLYLPEGVSPLVAPGQRCIAGETVVADLRSQEPARTAERR